MIFVVNKKRGAPPGSIYIGRGTPLGNPFYIGRDGDRGEVIEKYTEWLKAQPNGSPALKMLEALAEKHEEDGVLYLACWCKPLACHGDVVAAAVRLFENR
jgi:hypothetical protein